MPYFLYLFIFSVLLAKLANCCSTFLSIHEIVHAEGGVMVIDDEYGEREIKATPYSVGSCSASSSFPTGNQFFGNYSLMGLKSTLGTDECVRKEIAGQYAMENMQAIIVETNGWLIEPQSIDLDDIDSQVNVPTSEAWMEAAAVFGLLDGQIIFPKTTFEKNTVLVSREYLIPKDSMAKMGLVLEDMSVPGGEFSGSSLFNCPFGKENPDSALCRIKATFESPVNKLIFLYARKQQSLTGSDSAIFLSQIDVNCGCRCTSRAVGRRELALPIVGAPEQCHRVDTTGPKTECDVIGKQWCSVKSSFAYKIHGEQFSNGVFRCLTEVSFSAFLLSDFSPNKEFVPAI